MNLIKRVTALLLILALVLSLSTMVFATATSAIVTPHITSFTIENDGLTSPAGASITEGGAASTWTVKSIDITQNNPAVALESGGFCAGKVTITVNEDFSGYNFVWLVKNKWSVECEGGVLASGTGRKSMPKVSDYKCSNAFYLQTENAAADAPCYYYDLEIVSAITTPHITSFTIENDGLTSPAGASITEGGAASTWTVKSIDITQNNPAVALESGGFCAGKVTITVNENFSGYNFVWLVKNKWSVECEGGVLASGTGRKSMPKASDYKLSNAFYLQTENAAADAPCYYYDLELTYPGKTNPAPTLSAAENGVERTSDTTATVKFVSDQKGAYYYTLAGAEDAVPTVPVTGNGYPMVSGENEIILSTLTKGAKKLYLMAKSADGTETDNPLVIDIPAYVRPTHNLVVKFTPGDAMLGYKVLSVTADGTPISQGKYGYTVEASANITVHILVPEGKKELKSVTLETMDTDKTKIQANVNGAESSFSFTMPDTDTRFASYTLKDADPSDYRYNLSFKATLLWDEQGDQELNRKGNVIFKDEAGRTIYQAKKGDKITATAVPRSTDSYCKFAFSEWESATEGVTLPENTKAESFTFTMPASDVTLNAAFINVGTEISWRTVPAEADTTVKMIIFGNKQNPYTYRKTSDGGEKGVFLCNGTGWGTRYAFDHWEIYRDDERLSDAEIDTTQTFGTPNQPGYYTVPKFDIEGEKMEIVGVFKEKSFATVTAAVNDQNNGSATVTVGSDTDTSLVVFEGQTVTLTATPGDRYTLKGWEVKADGSDTLIPTTPVEDNANQATFTMPATNKPITATAIFAVDPEKASKENVLKTVALYQPNGTTLVASGNKQKTAFTVTLPANTDTSDLTNMILKLTVSEYATVKKSGDTDNWPAAGKACGMELNKAATFTVTAENGDAQDYTVTITKAKSSEKNITAAVLLDQTGDITPLAVGTVSEDKIIFTLPSNTDKDVLNSIGMKYLKLTYPETATAKMETTDGISYDDLDGSYKWRNGDVMCNMSLNTPVKFTITAEDNTTKTYTAEIKYTAPNAPTLSNGSATRSSKTAATVKFTTNEAGNYFYKAVDHGAAVPTVDTSKNGTSAVKGENTITLSNLTEDARDIYIVVVNASRGESAALKVEIPAYGSGSETPDTGKFTITINAPKGGTITTNRTKADKGDEIIVTVKPDSGYQMVEGSLTYSLAVAGGETVKITGNRFTMPAGNVTITCKWETATTTAKGITSFSISGVVGAVNNTTNTITITLPRGTDVTKLTPVIATNGVKSLTPGSGETVDFTNAVTYTAAMEDGSSKTYTVTVYVDKGTLADQFWDKLTDFATQVPWWEYAKHQQSSSKYPKYW